MRTSLLSLLFLLLFQPAASAQKLDDAIALYRTGDTEGAIAMLEPLADRGNRDAAYTLGVIYDNRPASTRDAAIAAEWYRRAGEAGSSDGLLRYARMLDEGDGVPEDAREAVEIYQRLRKKRSDYTATRYAALHLGTHYRSGRGVDRDVPKAMKLFKEATRSKKLADIEPMIMGQLALADIYLQGDGVPADTAKAIEHLGGASTAGPGPHLCDLIGLLEAHPDYVRDPNEIEMWQTVSDKARVCPIAGARNDNSEPAMDRDANDLAYAILGTWAMSGQLSPPLSEEIKNEIAKRAMGR